MSSPVDEFFRQVFEYLKDAVGVPDAVYNPPMLWHISSPQSASEYLGVNTQGSIGFMSSTISGAPPDNLKWYFESVEKDGEQYSVITSVSTDYNWRYEQNTNGTEIIMAETQGDPSFASDNLNIFRIAGADNPFTINPYIALSDYVEYNPNNTPSSLPVISSPGIYTGFILDDEITTDEPTQQSDEQRLEAQTTTIVQQQTDHKTGPTNSSTGARCCIVA